MLAPVRVIVRDYHHQISFFSFLQMVARMLVTLGGTGSARRCLCCRALRGAAALGESARYALFADYTYYVHRQPLRREMHRRRPAHRLSTVQHGSLSEPTSRDGAA